MEAPFSTQDVAAGKLLIAEPFMVDPYFNRAVIILCEHNQEGSIGFIINKELDIKVNDLIADIPGMDSPVFYGGPVQTDTIHFLHNVGTLLDDSVHICGSIYWGGSFEKLKFLIDRQLIHAGNIRFFVGYSGWSEGQLEDEMKFGSWVLASADANYIFKEQPGEVWRKVLKNKGGNYEVIATMKDENLLN